jgi:hypothetical protein
MIKKHLQTNSYKYPTLSSLKKEQNENIDYIKYGRISVLLANVSKIRKYISLHNKNNIKSKLLLKILLIKYKNIKDNKINKNKKKKNILNTKFKKILKKNKLLLYKNKCNIKKTSNLYIKKSPKLQLTNKFKFKGFI